MVAGKFRGQGRERDGGVDAVHSGAIEGVGTRGGHQALLRH